MAWTFGCLILGISLSCLYPYNVFDHIYLAFFSKFAHFASGKTSFMFSHCSLYSNYCSGLQDAALLAVAILKKKLRGRTFLGCDNHPLSRSFSSLFLVLYICLFLFFYCSLGKAYWDRLLFFHLFGFKVVFLLPNGLQAGSNGHCWEEREIQHEICRIYRSVIIDYLLTLKKCVYTSKAVVIMSFLIVKAVSIKCTYFHCWHSKFNLK